MSPLPLPVRVAAGLVASAVEQARDLPRLVVEFPVTAVSQALQASMRVQQKVTDLAIKGDRALGSLRPAEEQPSWATFDDDVPPPPPRSSGVTELRPSTRRAPEPRFEVTHSEGPGTDTVVDIAAGGAADTAADVAAETTAAAAEAAAPERVEPTADAATGPNALPEYNSMTIPQLRGRLRHLSVEDLRTLLEWETTHGNRPPFVTMLSNRITTVTEG